ncbi:MAG: hypothetical protein K0V04_07435, partial [Deltaproteobacteria bacterium]|nr:hypothetical protein [Deltaproteobacteria bacterium]
MKFGSIGLVLSFVPIVAACDTSAEMESSLRAGGFALVVERWPPSGGTLNTASLGDGPLMRLLPPSYPGGLARVDDVVVHDVELVPAPIGLDASLWVSAPQGELVVATGDGVHKGEALVGSKWWLDSFHTHYLTVTEHAFAGHHGYQFEERWIDEENQSTPICEADDQGERWAYVVSDVLVTADARIEPDPGALLIACASGALGKAITWGFSPWHGTHADPLRFYQTGVRTVRADYCGDGVSWTEDGTWIQVSSTSAGLVFWHPKMKT